MDPPYLLTLSDYFRVSGPFDYLVLCIVVLGGLAAISAGLGSTGERRRCCVGALNTLAFLNLAYAALRFALSLVQVHNNIILGGGSTNISKEWGNYGEAIFVSAVSACPSVVLMLAAGILQLLEAFAIPRGRALTS